ncbi:hypothetical protein [Paramagnetospirillum kuznetsovii]|nr:hypothetical protein [Paramagnetospirillum kuznetsovii]
MARSDKGLDSAGPAETKAIHILLSAKRVAEEVENFRRRLGDPHMAPTEARRIAADMDEALSRLCNLIGLAIANINESANEHFRQHFDLLLDEVRGRLLQMNMDQLQKRLVAIRGQVEKALKDPVYRLGLSAKLERSYDEVVNMLTAMGATEDLGLDDRFLAEIVSDIRELAEIEIRVFKLIDFDAKPSI